jgi:dolichyl-phosphate-mannose-protein mannosyltransferase
VRRLPILGCAAALSVALALVFLYGVRDPWWSSADPDGMYVGSSLNILLGNHTGYLDHPGIPTQDALALGFGAEYMIEKAAGKVDSRQAFADKQLLELDRARPLYRGWSVAIFLGGVLLVYWTLARFLGHWTWGLAGGLLFVATPELVEISYLLRPDAGLIALSLAIAVLVATALERRSAWRYVAAAALLGLTMMVKLAAVGLAVPLALAAVWRPPPAGWSRDLLEGAGRWLRRHVFWLAPVAIGWIALCVVFNRDRLPVLTNDDQRHVLTNGGAALGGFLLCAAVAEGLRLPWARRLFSGFNALLLLAFTAGLALPASLILDDGIQAVFAIWDSLTGGRVNQDIDLFSDVSLDLFTRYPLRAFALVFALAVGAAVVGARRRTWWPALLALGSLVLAVMAAARYSYYYYYGPAYAVALPGALWLLRGRRAAVPPAGWAVVAALALPLFFHLDRPVATEKALNADAQRLADRLLKPGEVILAQPYFPIEDVRYDGVVDGFVDYVPATYPYRFLEAGSARVAERGLKPRYYVAPIREVQGIPDGARVDLGHGVSYVLRPTSISWGPHGRYGVAEIVG